MRTILGFIVVFVLWIIPVHRSQEMELDGIKVATLEKPTEPKITIIKSHYNYVYSKLRYEEGNYAWLKNDFGGETYGGITRNYNPQWAGWKVIDSIKIVTGKNGKKRWKLEWNEHVAEAEPHVKDFYETWWKNWNMDIIRDTLAAQYTFDFVICGGPSTKVVQECLNEFGYDFKVNGRVSTKMIEAIDKLDPIVYVEKLRIMRRQFYITIADKLHRVKDKHGKYLRDKDGNYVYAKTQKDFLDGWLIRADRIKPELKARVNRSRQTDNQRM